MTDKTSTSSQDDSPLVVYGDLVELYPDNEGYARKYIDLLIEADQLTSAREILQRLHSQLLEKGNVNKANELIRQYPQIGRIRAIAETEMSKVKDLLPDEMQSKLWLLLHQQRLKEGRHLFHQGDKGDTMYLLLQGELAIFTSAANGKTILLNLVEPGDVVGEGCLLDPGVRSADVVANKDSTVVKLPRKKMLQALMNNPGLEAELQRLSNFRYMTCLISGNPLLQKIPVHMRHDMALDTEVRTYTSGELIHAAGDELTMVDMLIRGDAAYTLTINKKRHVLFDLKLGELIGDTSAVRKSSCPADVVAMSDVSMAHIPYSCFKNIVEAFPPLREGLMSHAEQQRIRLMRKVTSLQEQ